MRVRCADGVSREWYGACAGRAQFQSSQEAGDLITAGTCFIKPKFKNSASDSVIGESVSIVGNDGLPPFFRVQVQVTGGSVWVRGAPWGGLMCLSTAV